MPTIHLPRSACGILLGSLLALSSSPSAFAADTAPQVSADVVYERVSPASGPATEIGCFGTSPESPDGRKIVYVAFEWPRGGEDAGFSKGTLFLCDADLKNHVKLRDISQVRWHDGAMQLWLDNDTLAYMDYLPERQCYATYVIRKNGALVPVPSKGSWGTVTPRTVRSFWWWTKRNIPRAAASVRVVSTCIRTAP